MNDFHLWFITGLEHILDLQGYDHILYIVVLALPFSISDWRKLVFLISAFTLGHCLTLALSTFDIIKMPQEIVEIWIAATIVISCILNLHDLRKGALQINTRYGAAAIFGCIHGLGFSYLLKSMLAREQSVIFPLFSFNLGLEAGQLIIILILLSGKYFLEKYAPAHQKIIATTITFVILLIALYLGGERIISCL